MFFYDWCALPSGYSMQYIEIARFFKKKKFEYCYLTFAPVSVRYTEDTIKAFNYYYGLWSDFKLFGLAHGGGTLAEPRWYLDILKFFSGLHENLAQYKGV